MRKLLMLIAMMVICNAYGDTVVFVSNDAQYGTTTCTNNGNITIPSPNPTKAGYRFVGWRQATTVADYAPVSGTSYSPNKSGTGAGTWTVTFPYGYIAGNIRCASTVINTSGTCYYDNTKACVKNADPSGSGKYCWCKITSTTNAGDLHNVMDVSSLQWVGYGALSNADYCWNNCAYFCARDAASNIGLRKGFFGLL